MDKERKILQALADCNSNECLVEELKTFSQSVVYFHNRLQSGADAKQHLANAIAETDILLDQMKIMHGIENSVMYCRLTNLARSARNMGFNDPERVNEAEDQEREFQTRRMGKWFFRTPDIGSTVYVNKNGGIFDGTITAIDGGIYYGKTRIGRVAFAFTDEDINSCVWLTEKEAKKAVEAT